MNNKVKKIVHGMRIEKIARDMKKVADSKTEPGTYYSLHRDRLLAYGKQYYRKNRSKILAGQRAKRSTFVRISK